jgi:hypothetical protein
MRGRGSIGKCDTVRQCVMVEIFLTVLTTIESPGAGDRNAPLNPSSPDLASCALHVVSR